MTNLPTPTEALADRRTIVQRMHEAAIAAYQSAGRLSNPDLFDAAMRMAHQATVARVVEIVATGEGAGTVVDTIDGPITIAQVGYGLDESDNEVAMVLMTSDGDTVDRSDWHRGDDDVDRWVRYEFWTLDGDSLVDRRHGFAHHASRKIVQVG